MIADTIKEFPFTLADIEREVLNDEFTHTTKNKIYNKDPNVSEVLSLFDDIFYHIYQPLRSGMIWHKVNFLSGV